MSLNHDWMRTTLEALFDATTVDQIKSALASDATRETLRQVINANTVGLGQIPDGQYADNLFQGLLALRIKFDRATSMKKLEVNLAMRNSRHTPS